MYLQAQLEVGSAGRNISDDDQPEPPLPQAAPPAHVNLPSQDAPPPSIPAIPVLQVILI